MRDELSIKISPSGTIRIEADDKQIGLVQSLELKTVPGEPLPELEIVFPQIPEDSDSPVKDRIKEYAEIVDRFPFCTVVFKPLDETEDGSR